MLDLIIPPKFKVFNFAKYIVTSCPSMHLIMHCQKMVEYMKNEKFLIHYFQDSLSGFEVHWYIQLNHLHIRLWKDLLRASLAQYKHVMDMAPDKSCLQHLEKKAGKSTPRFRKGILGLVQAFNCTLEFKISKCIF